MGFPRALQAGLIPAIFTKTEKCRRFSKKERFRAWILGCGCLLVLFIFGHTDLKGVFLWQKN